MSVFGKIQQLLQQLPQLEDDLAEEFAALQEERAALQLANTKLQNRIEDLEVDRRDAQAKILDLETDRREHIQTIKNQQERLEDTLTKESSKVVVDNLRHQYPHLFKPAAPRRPKDITDEDAQRYCKIVNYAKSVLPNVDRAWLWWNIDQLTRNHIINTEALAGWVDAGQASYVMHDVSLMWSFRNDPVYLIAFLFCSTAKDHDLSGPDKPGE